MILVLLLVPFMGMGVFLTAAFNRPAPDRQVFLSEAALWTETDSPELWRITGSDVLAAIPDDSPEQIPPVHENEVGDSLERDYQVQKVQGNYTAAQETLRLIVARNPEEARFRFELGLLLAAQDPERALGHLAQSAEMDPTFAASTSVLEESIRAARRFADPAYSLLSAGRGLAVLGEWWLAAEAFRNTIRVRPDYAEAWAMLGEALQHIPGKEGDARESLEFALELDSQSLAVHTLLSLYWQRQERYDLAQEYLQRAFELDPDNPALYAEQGRLQSLRGELDAAAQSYQQAVGMARDPLPYLHQLARFTIAHNYLLHEVGLPAARRAVSQAPDDPASLDVMAELLIYLGDDSSAQRFLERALVVEPNYPEAHVHLGFLYLLRGEKDRAHAELTLAQSLDPRGNAGAQAVRLLEQYYP